MRKYLTLFISLVLAGCAASGTRFQLADPPSGNDAAVYIYRPDANFLITAWPEIFINSEEKFALKHKGYGVVYLAPGQHTIRAEGSLIRTGWHLPPVELTQQFEPNQTYFIRVLPRLGSVYMVSNTVVSEGHVEIARVPKEQALSEISTTRSVQNSSEKMVFMGMTMD